MYEEKISLRTHFRKLRRQLLPKTQRQNAHALQHQLLRSLLLLRYQSFAIYLPADGEIGTTPIIAKLWEYAKTTALPVLSHRDFSTEANVLQMHFLRFTEHSPLTPGPYNLVEPKPSAAELNVRASSTLPELIFLPLVAFDRTGARLGMGGGFYDRYTAHPARQNRLRIGLAHSFQEADRPLPAEHWDQPLDAVITEREIIAFNNRATTLIGSKL